MALSLAELASAATSCGLVAVGARAAERPEPAATRLEAAHRAGALERPAYLNRNLDRRLDPRVQRPGTVSVVSLGMRYRTRPPPPRPDDGLARGRVAAYAIGPDYHRVLGERLERMFGMLVERGLLRMEDRIGAFVDTAPVAEKALAQRAGLGWQGKHTNLVSRAQGSWLLLGELFLGVETEESVESGDHCGTCTRCIEACPTDALDLDRPYELRIASCISYLTLEERGPIPEPMRAAVQDWLFGCDLCLDVCPFNRFAETGAADPGETEAWYPALLPILEASNSALRRRAAGTALSYVGVRQWRRNALVAAGNLLAGDRLAPEQRTRLMRALGRFAAPDANPLLREHALWALERA